MDLYDLPKDNIAEITLIGTGGGYGESCGIHLGNQEWIVVDSCQNPNTHKSLPLEYLKEIGVNVSSNVKLLVCTHWHDDHILGLSELFKECNSAQLAMATPNDRKKFLFLVGLDHKKITGEASISSTTEFNKCIDIVRNRNSSIMEATPNRLLCENTLSSVYSLSPSDFTISEYDKEISSLITEFGTPTKKIVIKTPNSKSVVLFLKLGDHRALLGTDLEVSSDEREGWLSILNNRMNLVSGKKATLFKVSHHGSKNGYHERIWLEMLEKKPVSKLTPWNKSTKLPDVKMLKIFCGHSDKVYMTSAIINGRPKKRDKRTEKILRRFKHKLREEKFHKGIIRCRIDMNNTNATWETNLFDEAFHVNSELSKL